MRQVVWMMSISLDGYIAGPGGDLSWNRVDDEFHEHVNEVIAGMGAFLDGRVIHEMMAAYWPTADQDPNATAHMRAFAPIWINMPKIVYSRTLTKADWNATVRHEVDPAEIAALKAEPGGDLLLGGADLASTFLALDLVDEFRIYVHPVLIGHGIPMFPASGTQRALALVEHRTFSSGVVLLRYQVQR